MPQFPRFNAIDQLLDIAGSPSQTSSATLTDETSGFGAALAGQTGAVANITAAAGGLSTFTGLTGMTANSVGNYLTVSGADTTSNGTFLITNYISATSVQVANATPGTVPDPNNGAITWTERRPYTLLDDLNFERTDRQAIKGVNYDQPIPTYVRPTAIGTNVPANLSNIAGKTLDSFARSVSRGQFNWAVEATVTNIYGVGVLKHSDATDETGVPCFDAAPWVGDYNTCFVEVTDSVTGNELEVLAGLHIGEKIFGVTQAAGSTSPNSVGIKWYSCPNGGNIATSSTAYTWEQGTATAKTGTTSVTVTPGTNGASALTGLTAGGFATPADVGTWLTISGSANPANDGTFVILSVQSGTAVTVQNRAAVAEGPTASVTWTQYTKTQPTFVNLTYGYNQRLDQLDQNAFRFPMASGLVGDADLRQDIIDLQSTGGWADGTTNLSTYLTNTGANFVFFTLPGGAGDTVVSALNALNAQIGNRTYSPLGVLTNGQTITASLQALSNAISAASVVRYITRLAAAAPANVAITLPGAATYTIDGTNNGRNLWVFWRGILRDPGSVVNGDDYAETSTTQITPYATINKNDHINFFVVQ
jgi:hypothetical protein